MNPHRLFAWSSLALSLVWWMGGCGAEQPPNTGNGPAILVSVDGPCVGSGRSVRVPINLAGNAPGIEGPLLPPETWEYAGLARVEGGGSTARYRLTRGPDGTLLILEGLPPTWSSLTVDLRGLIVRNADPFRLRAPSVQGLAGRHITMQAAQATVSAVDVGDAGLAVTFRVVSEGTPGSVGYAVMGLDGLQLRAGDSAPFEAFETVRNGSFTGRDSQQVVGFATDPSLPGVVELEGVGLAVQSGSRVRLDLSACEDQPT
jgi:hypothetical protein